MNRLLNWIEKRCHWLKIPVLVEGLVLCQIAGFLMVMADRSKYSDLLLVGALVQQGELWRLASFLMIPPSTSPIFLFFALYLFYLYGSALRQHWGEVKLNIFFLIGFILTVSTSFIFPMEPISNLYLLGSFFLAFAAINPDFELRLFFILPVKIKWLAIFTGLLYGFSFFTGGTSTKFVILAAVANFLIFFADDVFGVFKNRVRKTKWKAKQIGFETNYLHRCSVCGKTDVDAPSELFRYSTRDGESLCFCEEHLNP